MKNNNNFCSSHLKKGIISDFRAFTLIEIMIGILISSGIIIIGLNVFNSILVGKVKLIESTNISKESFKFSQKFFEEIKKGGLIDYEEYFNRKVVGNTTYSSGHFDKPTGFGNFGKGGNVGNATYGNGFYYCRSNNGTKMTGTGCVDNFNTVSGQNSQSQRYGQYSFQFIDYNSNYDSDVGDEDGVNGIIGDDDDEYLGEGPEVFTAGEGVTELYLISADKKTRTLFRWTVKNDPNYKDNTSCSSSDLGKTLTGTGCLGTIEFLRLEGKDWGSNHALSGNGLYDGVIDTWLIDKDFSGETNAIPNDSIVAGSNDSEQYWQKLFPNSINVKSFDIRAYPNKDKKLAWKEDGIDVSPYVRINMVLTPSWKVKKAIKGKVPEFNISTTVNLTEIFSR